MPHSSILPGSLQVFYPALPFKRLANEYCHGDWHITKGGPERCIHMILQEENSKFGKRQHVCARIYFSSSIDSTHSSLALNDGPHFCFALFFFVVFVFNRSIFVLTGQYSRHHVILLRVSSTDTIGSLKRRVPEPDCGDRYDPADNVPAERKWHAIFLWHIAARRQ